MEKDLAFAELATDTAALKALEEEQQRLNKTAAELLKSVGLTIEDLSPRYRCTKCNDTGYIGTKRCDCFDK